ncbi:hypothetical protein E1A91_D12G149100v1 [Gossypium mustelinum]|uniref:Proline-rich protein n=1 Tax=Gossypium mustelinum TaxID=34275 RepID=A0A5D2SEH5_GOSMU|nr:hypothetical protein E1A91_D12G149100v1 [Gossypium mustelinum]
MAIARSLLATCLLLCSLLVIAYANDYGGYDSSKSPAYDYGAKPEAEQKTNYETKPMPNGEEKPEYGTKPVNQQQPEEEEKPDYGTKQNFYKPELEDKEKAMPEESEKPGYSTKPQPEEEGKPEYGTKPQPEEEEKPDYGTKQNFYKPELEDKEKAMPEESEKPGYSTKQQPEEEGKPEYGTKPQPEDKEKEMAEPEETEKPGYSTKPVYQTQPEKEEKPEYGTKINFYQQQPEEKEGKEKPNYDNKEQAEEYKKPEGEEQPNLPIGVEGLVLCKSGPKYYPIQGALARITCLVVDENGYEKTHSVCSGETDAKGYFFARLSPSISEAGSLSKLTECKALLESSPLETCNVPVNVNKGISGAPLSDFRILNHMRIKLYSVGPFFFTSQPNNSVPNGY